MGSIPPNPPFQGGIKRWAFAHLFVCLSFILGITHQSVGVIRDRALHLWLNFQMGASLDF